MNLTGSSANLAIATLICQLPKIPILNEMEKLAKQVDLIHLTNYVINVNLQD